MSYSRIVTVCAANICRSPAMLLALREHLNTLGGTELRWSSAGVVAEQGRFVCERVGARFGKRAGAGEIIESHRSARLDTEVIDDAAIILTATTSERGAVALLRPAARARTFTFAEAVALAEFAAMAGRKVSGGQLAELVSVLHDQRGRFTIAEDKRRVFRRRKATSGVDIPDAHTTTVSHERVLDAVVDRAAAFTRAISELGVAVT